MSALCQKRTFTIIAGRESCLAKYAGSNASTEQVVRLLQKFLGLLHRGLAPLVKFLGIHYGAF